VALRREQLYTVEDWLNWDEDFRCEIIDGEAYMMAQPTIAHQHASVGITSQLWNFLKGKPCKVYSAPCGVRLSKTEETVFEPDIIIVCDKEKLSSGKICNGAPDMIVEILSPSTSSKDKVLKFNKYQSAGVREYWIVDPVDNTVQVNVLQNGRYAGYPYDGTSTVTVSIFEGCEIDLKDVFLEENNENKED